MGEKGKIEKIMQVENLNSAQFATEIGIQSSTLSHILNGRNKPSLDVLKKILNRFRTINPEWLILDIGTMYRQEKNSQTLSLFDSMDENSSKSNEYTAINPQKSEPIYQEISEKKEIKVEQPVQHAIQPPVVEHPKSHSKAVKRIIVYYSDNTFEEFQSNPA